MKRLLFGIMTGIAVALGAMLNQPEASVAPTPDGRDPAPVQESAPLPPSARGYPAPVDPYPYPAPTVDAYPTPTEWGMIISCELWWVVCEGEEGTPYPDMPTSAPTPEGIVE